MDRVLGAVSPAVTSVPANQSQLLTITGTDANGGPAIGKDGILNAVNSGTNDPVL
jgi:hypothetical protein